jgi:hypothetical protein
VDTHPVDGKSFVVRVVGELLVGESRDVGFPKYLHDGAHRSRMSSVSLEADHNVLEQDGWQRIRKIRRIHRQRIDRVVLDRRIALRCDLRRLRERD